MTVELATPLVLPTVTVEAVLIDPDQRVPPPAHVDSLIGRRLGDISLAALVNAAAADPCIQLGIPEEIVYGHDIDPFY